jgi:glycine dehydrogenase subunit 1
VERLPRAGRQSLIDGKRLSAFADPVHRSRQGACVDYAPHTDEDIEAMLGVVGRSSLDELFTHIPAGLRPKGEPNLPHGVSEDETLQQMGRYAAANATDAVCFAGGGAYDHYVPAMVGAIISRGELLTSYTPYQPEVSQGMLQALFEYQTVISELTGLPVSNASLYDGGSAVAEAVSMACAGTRRNGVVMSVGLDHPSRTVVRTYGHPLDRGIAEVDYGDDGRTPVTPIDDDVAAVIIQQPNALGIVEDVRAHAEAAHAAGAQLIVKLEPTAVGLLATPGSQGADLVVGEGQPLGQGLTYGGPTFGFLACRSEQVRRIPGRIVGRTADAQGRRGYVMTLRAREQDIRREKATSNICTNQTLCALAALVYLSWLGPQGLRELASTCLARARHAAARLAEIDGVDLAVDGPFLKEFPLRLSVQDPHAAVDALHDAGFLVGPVVADGPAAGAVLVAVTERRTASEVEALADALARIVKEQS